MLCVNRFNSRTPCGVRRGLINNEYAQASFNSRTPCGVRHSTLTSYTNRLEFQFTHPVWGATRSTRSTSTTSRFQFTHPVWDATSALGYQEIESRVSIHAPRVGCDDNAGAGTGSSPRFNSRTPCGVRHHNDTHHTSEHNRFNSRTPCGVRQSDSSLYVKVQKFQFTHPVWGATQLTRYWS